MLSRPIRCAIALLALATPGLASVQNALLPARAAPVTDALHFDLVCDLRGRVVQRTPTALFARSAPAPVSHWRYRTRDIVDLQTMLYCDPVSCRRYGRNRIAAVNAERIVLADWPGFIETVRRRDGYYSARKEDVGEVSLTTGYCHHEPFSGFPPVVPGY